MAWEKSYSLAVMMSLSLSILNMKHKTSNGRKNIITLMYRTIFTYICVFLDDDAQDRVALHISHRSNDLPWIAFYDITGIDILVSVSIYHDIFSPVLNSCIHAPNNADHTTKHNTTFIHVSHIFCTDMAYNLFVCRSHRPFQYSSPAFTFLSLPKI